MICSDTKSLTFAVSVSFAYQSTIIADLTLRRGDFKLLSLSLPMLCVEAGSSASEFAPAPAFRRGFVQRETALSERYEFRQSGWHPLRGHNS